MHLSRWIFPSKPSFVWAIGIPRLGVSVKLEDLQQRYAELSPNYGHLGVP